MVRQAKNTLKAKITEIMSGDSRRYAADSGRSRASQGTRWVININGPVKANCKVTHSNGAHGAEMCSNIYGNIREKKM